MSAHAEFLRSATNDPELAGQLKSDFRQANLSDNDRQMLEFVDKLTRIPWMLGQADVASLRQSGFQEVEILHIVMGCAHFNYLNRMADGTGIRFEYQSELPEFRPPHGQSGPWPPPKGTGGRVVPEGGAELSAPLSPVEDDAGLQGSEPSNLFCAMKENPDASMLAREWRDYQLKPTAQLDARKRGRLALFISALNCCGYSAFWYRRLLAQLGERSEILDCLSRGEQPATPTELETLEFEHSKRLTLEPWTNREFHIDQLRQAGLDDAGILQLTMLISYLSFETRVAFGLGVGIETTSP